MNTVKAASTTNKNAEFRGADATAQVISDKELEQVSGGEAEFRIK